MFDIESFLHFWQYDAGNPLMFTSKGFLLMFAVFYCIYFRIQRHFNLRIVYVTLFSIYFYYLTSGFYFWLLVLISFTDHSIGFFIYNTKTQWRRKLLLLLSLSIDLGLLCYFKYTNFTLEIVDNLANRPFEAKNIFLPIGISFYIFQSLSYVIDIYRRQLQPTEKWVDFMFFLSFFPQLVAGPIVRARNFLPQIMTRPITTLPMFNKGLMLILTGLIKKVFIADFIGANFVDRVFDAPQIYSGFENLMGIYGYALQIYCDFSGYTDIAIGIALLLGFKFPDNFNNPYRAATVTEFWHRWHISLSTWLRDYLYISLGGNRKGNIRTYINLMITMLLGGLWHGAAWHFVV
ncbi:MAG: MBOAT family O-acyltransferase, partial [Bacteroidales bacterium]|nr:MBOAT family O-acyltransferase [Bacteroidales bacterium]